MATPDQPGNGEVVIPSISFSLAAIIRTRPQKQTREFLPNILKRSQKYTREYALVHEKPPRGWWLPGGGVEHHDETPLAAAVRETVEEAGSPSLLPLLAAMHSDARVDESKQCLLPTMTHLISLEQSRGRIRFIFRGEWIDDYRGDCDGQKGKSNEPKSILKRPPGDKESIEAKWISWDEVQELKDTRKREKDSLLSNEPLSMDDPWLRGHEPLTFFGMLEASARNGSDPGLPVHRITFSGEHKEWGAVKEEVVTGAFFGRIHSNKSIGLTLHGRAALLTHLKCRLLVYGEGRHKIVVDTATNAFPLSPVYDQNEITLKELVDAVISDYVEMVPSGSRGNNDELHRVGLLRVEHIIHGNGREATLTVFPCLCLSAIEEVRFDNRANPAMSWVSVEELGDDIERKLVKAVQSGECVQRLHILRDNEGPV